MLVTFKRHEDGKLRFAGNMNYLLRLVHLFTLVSSVTGGRSHRYYAPRFNERSKNITSFIGDTAILYCSVVNLGTKTVIWRKVPSRHPLTVGTFTFISDKSYSVHRNTEKNEWNLIIKNVQPKHAGLYECHISTKEEQKFNVFLNVVERHISGHISDISLTGTTFVNVGDPVFLVCKVSGGDYIPEDIDWFRDGNEIKSDAVRVKITKRQSVTTRSITSQLLIKHSYMSDAGNYICRSSMDITSLSVQVLNGMVAEKATTHNTRRGTRTNGDQKQQNTSKSSKCSASSARWWLVFGLISLLYLNGATVLGP